MNPALITKSLQLYLADIREMPQLTREECFHLAVRVQSGDEDARTQMILTHLPLVVSIAKRYGHFGVPLADLIAEGNVGLMKAIDRFDPYRGAKLSTYAVCLIRQAIIAALSDHRRTIRIPSSALSKAASIKRVASSLTDLLNRAPTIRELAKETETPAEKIAHLTAMAEPPLSMAQPVQSNAEDDRTLEDSLADDRAISPSEAGLKSDNATALRSLLDNLDARERRIIELRHGLDGNEPRTLEYVAQEFGLTRERIRQLQDNATKKLRTAWTLMERRMPDANSLASLKIANTALARA